MAIIPGRQQTHPQKPFARFPIGRQINNLLAVNRRGGAVAVAMPRMQSELARKSEAGLLWLRNFIFSCDVMSVQYWESTKKLISYDWDGEHFPAWAAFNREPKDNSAVGI